VLLQAYRWIAALAQAVQTRRSVMPRRIIIDTDPSIDDAIAILLALRRRWL
jgi:hypothetical protein